MVCLPEFKAGRAETCEIDRVTDQGAGKEYFVRLPDGYLLPCGSWLGAEKRAETLAALVNVLMRWEGQWPPVGNVDAILEGNFIDEMRIRASKGQPVPDFSMPGTNGVRGAD